MTPASPERDKVEAYLGHALAGGLIGQVARHRGVDLYDLFDEKGPTQRLQAYGAEFTELGIDPFELAQQALQALAALFTEPANAENVVKTYTEILWAVLGDPSSGAPPEIYRKAGVAMHCAVLSVLDPTILDDK